MNVNLPGLLQTLQERRRREGRVPSAMGLSLHVAYLQDLLESTELQHPREVL